jgi:DNA gyrase/topoisomerase IV subunit B
MWAGSHKPLATQMMIFAPQESRIRACLETVIVAHALCKCFDEPIVNAIDQAQKCATTTEIRVDFAQDGCISIANNGDGIPITKQPGEDIWIPQFLFSMPFTGSNLDANSSSTVGGTNGLGVKITNILARDFTIETHDLVRDRSYWQTWTNGMRECGEARIEERKNGANGTRVTFTPDYAHFGMEIPADSRHPFEKIAFARTIWVAFYVACALPHVSVFWNGSRISWTADDFARAIFGGAEDLTMFAHRACSKTGALTVFCSPATTTKFQISLLNGIVVPDGNHLRGITNQIRATTRTQLARRLSCKSAQIDTRSISSVKLAIIVIGRTPGVNWSSQSKDVADFSAPDLKQYLTPRPAFFESVADSVATTVEAKLNRAKPARHITTIIAPLDKYVPAKYAGTAKSAQCRLFLAEGASAMNHMGQGITRTIKFKRYGILSLGGVIMNVRRESEVTRANPRATRQTVTRSRKLIENQFFTSFLQITGLNLECTYQDERDVARLRYGGIIACVDQDLDGTGNIFSLVLSIFQYYWPHLVRIGYVQRLATPIVRAYPRAKNARIVEEFYSEREFREWSRGIGDAQLARSYKIRYNKGIGSNTMQEIVQIFNNFAARIITYRLDIHAPRIFDIYLGCDADKRKVQLSRTRPAIHASTEEARATRHVLPSSYHLQIEAHAYQLDNLERKLNHVIDGANQVSRKIINGLLAIFAGSKQHEECKVADLAGTISATQQYHHGEASMQDSITRRGFIAPGGIQLPFIIPLGGFGTRMMGGQDASKPRYLHATLNTHLMSRIFSDDDYALLSAQIVESKPCEPQHFAPTIPLVLLETVSVPAHGWNISIWAREFVDVLANLRILIRTNGAGQLFKMRPCVFPRGQFAAQCDIIPALRCSDGTRVICDAREMNTMWHGVIFENEDDEVWSVGTYYWESADTIHIIELPLCTWTTPYTRELAKVKVIRGFTASPNEGVDIHVTLDADWMREMNIRATPIGTGPAPDLYDPIVIALHLRDRMCDSLNLMDNAYVHSFVSYEDILEYWFPIKRDFYARRVARLRDHCCAWITYYENIVRYLTSPGDKIAQHMSDEDADAHLESREYSRMNAGALHSARLKYEEFIRPIIFGESANFDYILNLRERDHTVNGRAIFAKHLDKYRAQLAELEEDARIIPGQFPFIGAKIWLRELEELERAVIRGRETQWQYDNYNRYDYRAT